MSNLFEDIKSTSNLITGHVNPDGDALGSALAFKLILDSKGVDSDVFFDIKGNVPSNLSHLPIELIINQPEENYENVYVFDCGNSERLGKLENLALNSKRVTVIDHHINPTFGDIQIIDSNAASTTQVLFREIISANIEIDKNIANCLMTVLITDTGYLNDNIESSEPDFLIDSIRLVNESNVALLLKEQDDKSFKGSLRSRNDLDVQQIASLFGGGGHKAASGFSTNLSIEEIKIKVKNAIKSQI